MRTLILVAGGVLASSVLAAQAVTQDVPTLDPVRSEAAQAVVELFTTDAVRATAGPDSQLHMAVAAVEG
jgi:hypothetical protein